MNATRTDTASRSAGPCPNAAAACGAEASSGQFDWKQVFAPRVPGSDVERTMFDLTTAPNNANKTRIYLTTGRAGPGSGQQPAGESASSFWPNYLRGQAYLRLGKGAEAAAEFRTILEHRGWQPLSVFYPLARLGLARASVLAGDAAAARSAYQDFFAMWKDADPDLPVLVAAKQELGALK